MDKLKGKFIITIDTEPDCDINWNRRFPLSFKSIIFGIPYLLRPIWDKYNINPIYFVSPKVVMDDECCKILKEEIKKGAIIGAHLHSECIAPNTKNIDNNPSLEFPCYAHSTSIEFEKIKNLTNLIKKNLNIRPIWYRAARYGADLDTIKSLQKLGYKYDSSVTPGIDWTSIGGPPHQMAPLQPYLISKYDYYKTCERKKDGIIEVPITIFEKRFGFGSLLSNKWFFYNWLRPSHMTVFEQKRLINKLIKIYKKPTFVLMFHSMEIIPKATPFVRSKLGRYLYLKRLSSVIRYLSKVSSLY